MPDEAIYASCAEVEFCETPNDVGRTLPHNRRLRVIDMNLYRTFLIVCSSLSRQETLRQQ